ncbi:component of SufBCD complex [Allosediminivita pacifica]|nr:component of SufBCD complex [Allosediminivita pacifica]
MRSFSNLWFWIVLAAVWSMASHRVLGVPIDMVTRARRDGGQATLDLEELARINAERQLLLARESGLWMSALVAGVLSMALLLGFLYRVEFAQALFLLGFPLLLVRLLELRAAQRVHNGERHGEALLRLIRAHRVITQMIGMVAIFVTAVWGMYQNLVLGPFYG